MLAVSLRASRHARGFTEVWSHTLSILRRKPATPATLTQDLTIELPADSKDHIIPYCADQRHPADTLFFIAEEDWRLAEAHCGLDYNEAELTDSLKMALERPESRMEMEAARGEHRNFPRWQVGTVVEPTADDQGGPPKTLWKDEGLQFHKRAKKPLAGEFSTTTRWLVDMIKICTEADRAGAKDLLWMSWLPKKSKRVSYPTRYSGLIALTAEGARKLMLNFDDWFPEPCNWDTELRKGLGTNPAMQTELAAGYLFPCLGHFTEHESAIAGGVRQAEWDLKHLIQDTRPSKLTAGHFSLGVCALAS